MQDTINSNEFNTYNIHGLLKIKSYLLNILPQYFLQTESDSSTGVPKYDIEILPFKLINWKEKNKHFIKIASNLYYDQKRDLVISNPGIFSFNINWGLHNLGNLSTTVYISKLYELINKTFLKIPISTLFPIQAYIQHIMHVKLLQKEHTFLIGGCIELPNKDGSIILTSMGGIGKTTTTIKILKEYGGKYLGDDMIIINKNGNVYSYPKALRIRKIESSLISMEKHITPKQLLGGRSIIKNKSEIKKICLLEISNKSELLKINTEQAISKLMIINRKLLPYFMERTILAASYMDDSFNLHNLMQKEEMILRSFVKKADCYILRDNPLNSFRYKKHLKSIINE